MHFLFLARPEEVKVGSRQSRETNSRLQEVISRVGGEISTWEYLGSRPELKAGVHGRIGSLSETEILQIVWRETLSEPDGLGGTIDKVLEH